MIKGYSKIICKDNITSQFLTFKGISLLNKQLQAVKIFINVNNESIEFNNNSRYITINNLNLEVIKVICGLISNKKE